MINDVTEDITGMDNRSEPIAVSKPLSSNTGANININKKDLSDPSIQRNLQKMKGSTVTVVDEESSVKHSKLTYLSNIKDSDSGDLSKQFLMNGKNYQMVRALTPTNEKVIGVYSLDEVDEAGENIIYPQDYFESNIAKKDTASGIQEKSEVKPEKKGLNPLNLGDYKYFLVNTDTAKIRKFKTAEDLANAGKTKDETFMSLTQFKKYIDGTIFGQKKRTGEISEETDPIQLHAKAVKLMQLIQSKVPSVAIDSIKKNKNAQRETILMFAEMVGVPKNLLPQIIADIKDTAATQSVQSTTTMDGTSSTSGPIKENKIISKNKLIETAIGVKTIKVKNI